MPDWNALNALDWIILGLMLWSVGWAAFRGFSSELFSILGLIAAFFITIYTGHLLDGPLAGMLPDNAIARMVSRAIIFLICIIVINLIASLAAATLRALLSRLVDHSLGLLFGFLRGALIILLPFLLVNLYIDPKVYPVWLTQAHAYPFLQNGAHLLREVLPASQIHDKERTDFSIMKKAAAENDAVVNPKPEKDKVGKSKDSASNPTMKDLIKVFQELFAK